MPASPIRIASSEQHVLTIDFARGVMAFAVMGYHLFHYEGIGDADRVSFYAVYSFFSISGIALYLAYRDKLQSNVQIRSYLIRRYFRLAPLFIFALVLMLLLQPSPSSILYLLAVNASLTFGFANPGSSSLLTGGWSIGIEFVFYLIFPFMLIVSGSTKRLGIVALASIVVSAAFANRTLGMAQNMTADLWLAYTQPLAFFGYFAAGVFIAAIYVKNPQLKGGTTLPWVILIVGALPFVTIGPQPALNLLTGYRGACLMIGTILIVAAVTFMKEPSGRLASFARLMGALSYPVYLLHPLVYTYLQRFSFSGSFARLTVTVVTTVVLSLVVHRLIERPGRALGKRISSV